MAGYWKNPKETELVLTKEGWLKTGDIMRMDEEGFLYYLDRKKEMINVSGFNVYPSEVESVIARHVGVAEVAITGAKNRLGEEVVKAWIIKKDRQLTKQSILKHCYHELTHYKVPKKIEFTKSLPKSAVGKILRYQLK